MTLFSIQDYLTYITESFAALLDLDFTIIDADPIKRVSGTGYYKDSPQQHEWHISYTRQVIESGLPLRAVDTSEYRKARRESFSEKDPLAAVEHYSILLQPIIYQDKVIGVIAIASFNEMQQKLLLQKQDSLMEYLKCISELISLKLLQEELHAKTEFERNQLDLIYENMSNGVVLCKDGEIIRMNSLAEKLLVREWPEPHKLYIQDLTELSRLAVQTGETQRNELYHLYEGHSKILTVRAIPSKNPGNYVVCLILPFIRTQEEILQNDQEEGVTELVAANKEMLHLIRQIRTVALYDSNVLVTGESGTGKEMVARMLHSCSKRKNNPFVSINCAAIPETLLESELFGYEGGAFTGANKGGKIGKFMLANSGTLFLDEIGDMPLYLQAKLLRAISERKIDRIGSEQPIDVDVRIIAATNRNLEKMIREQTFREDLFYRLSVIPFMIPPLRERREDIVPLTKHFINKYNDRLQKQVTGISNAVMEIFLSYEWPGNVRELENCIEYMMNFEPTTLLSTDSLPLRLRQPKASGSGKKVTYGVTAGSLKERMAQYEKSLFLEFLEQHDGRPKLPEIDAFCKEMKISRATYYRKQAEAQQDPDNHQ